MSSFPPKDTDESGRDRMLMLLSVMEGFSGSKGGASSANDKRKTSPYMTDSYDHQAALHMQLQQASIAQVTPPTPLRAHVITPLTMPPGFQPQKEATVGRYQTANNGLRSLLMTSAHPLQNYSDLERQFPPSSSMLETRHTGSQLHRACRLNNHPDHQCSVMVEILQADGQSVRRRCELARLEIRDASSVFRTKRQHCEPYTLPLNLAILYQQSNAAHIDLKPLKLLAAAGPDVLTLADGPDEAGPLSIALRHHPQNVELVQLLLEANPCCAMVTDKRGNSPLHVACLWGASLQVIRELYFANPSALYMPNWNGETPYHIVQRNPMLSSSAIADFFFAVPARRERRKRRK